jgi:hypothetical protein
MPNDPKYNDRNFQGIFGDITNGATDKSRIARVHITREKV